VGIETNWDDWGNADLILDERLSGFTRYVKNFVMVGFGLANGGGLNLLIGQAGLNAAYVNGYEIAQTNSILAAITASATNHVFLCFTKLPDPISGTQSINIFYVINTTGIPPADSIKLGEVDTGPALITVIRPQNNNFKIHDAQLDTDVEGNQFQIKHLVTHKGTAFPTVPPPVSGQKFYRTDLSLEYFFDGAVWVSLAAGSTTFTVNLTATPAFDIGEFARVSADNTVVKAQADSFANAGVVGAAALPILATTVGAFEVLVGRRILAQLETGLIVAAGDRLYLSVTTAGALTNIPPSITGDVVKPMGWMVDSSAYVGAVPANSKADIIYQPETGVVL
jgi:hypothetical protein